MKRNIILLITSSIFLLISANSYAEYRVWCENGEIRGNSPQAENWAEQNGYRCDGDRIVK